MARVTKQGEELTVDLTGTAPQVSDRPINMPFVGTVDIAVWLTVRSVLLDTEVHGHVPVNEGLTRPIRIIAPKGCLANPIFPGADDRPLLPRQPACRHRHEGAGAGGAGAGFGRDRQSEGDRLLWPARSRSLGPYGDFRRQLRRPRWHRRHGCQSYAKGTPIGIQKDPFRCDLCEAMDVSLFG